MSEPPPIVAKVTPKRHRRKNKQKAAARRAAKEANEREQNGDSDFSEDEKVVIPTSGTYLRPNPSPLLPDCSFPPLICSPPTFPLNCS